MAIPSSGTRLLSHVFIMRLPATSPLLLTAGLPFRQSVRALRGPSNAPRKFRSLREKMEWHEEPKYKTLEASAADKKLPVHHFATDQFEPLEPMDEVREKHVPFFPKTMHRVSAPYVNDQSLSAAQINKNIFNVFRTTNRQNFGPPLKRKGEPDECCPSPSP